jgi:hypothetical protein
MCLFIHLIHYFAKESGISSNPANTLTFNLDMTVTISYSEIGKTCIEFGLKSTTIYDDLSLPFLLFVPISSCTLSIK